LDVHLQEKEKYELLAGQAKTAEDVTNLYADLIQSFKSIIGFIDPLHSKVRHDIFNHMCVSVYIGTGCPRLEET